MKVKILEPQSFTGTTERSALKLAAAWLAEQCADGSTPFAVVVTGTDASAIVSGADYGCIVFMKKGTAFK